MFVDHLKDIILHRIPVVLWRSATLIFFSGYWILMWDGFLLVLLFGHQALQFMLAYQNRDGAPSVNWMPRSRVDEALSQQTFALLEPSQSFFECPTVWTNCVAFTGARADDLSSKSTHYAIRPLAPPGPRSSRRRSSDPPAVALPQADRPPWSTAHILWARTCAPPLWCFRKSTTRQAGAVQLFGSYPSRADCCQAFRNEMTLFDFLPVMASSMCRAIRSAAASNAESILWM